jgi:thioesterase domain-containing protein
MFALVLVAACGAPSAVQPTLDALASLGYTCGEGQPDGVPSGLTGWHCPGPVAFEGGVGVEGNGAGVASMTLSVVWPAAADPAAARDVYRRIVTAVPPFDRAPALAEALASWTGAQQSTTIGGALVMAECIRNQCWVTIASTTSPMEPILLP